MAKTAKDAEIAMLKKQIEKLKRQIAGLENRCRVAEFSLKAEVVTREDLHFSIRGATYGDERDN